MNYSVSGRIIDGGRAKTVNAIISAESERAAKWRFICLATGRFGSVSHILVNGTSPHDLAAETMMVENVEH
jgi:hypothetical protein